MKIIQRNSLSSVAGAFIALAVIAVPVSYSLNGHMPLLSIAHASMQCDEEGYCVDTGDNGGGSGPTDPGLNNLVLNDNTGNNQDAVSNNNGNPYTNGGNDGLNYLNLTDNLGNSGSNLVYGSGYINPSYSGDNNTFYDSTGVDYGHADYGNCAYSCGSSTPTSYTPYTPYSSNGSSTCCSQTRYQPYSPYQTAYQPYTPYITPQQPNNYVNTGGNTNTNTNTCTGNSCNTTSTVGPTTVGPTIINNQAPQAPIVQQQQQQQQQQQPDYYYAARPIAPVVAVATPNIQNPCTNNPYVSDCANVSLQQIPYTGLDLGPVGTVLYWAFLILWCLAGAYLIVVKKVQNKVVSSIKTFLFGTPSLAATGTVQTVEAAKVHVSQASTTPGMDDFIFSQINRAHA